jgi:phosphopantetheinyl transferase (holo-ACP synthase)
MTHKPVYSKYVETIKKEDFMAFYSSCNPADYFSPGELMAFSFPANAGSLAGRYLIKKTICDYLNKPGKMNAIEILNNESGKPDVHIGDELVSAVGEAGIKKILCSISHSRDFIAGMTIICF